MADDALHALDVPPDVVEQGGHEVLRVFVSEGALSVALRRSFEDPGTWGVMLVELARHAARIYASETDLPEDEALRMIVEGLKSELESALESGPAGSAH